MIYQILKNCKDFFSFRQFDNKNCTLVLLYIATSVEQFAKCLSH